MLKLVGSYLSPSPQSLGVVVCPWCQPWVASSWLDRCVHNCTLFAVWQPNPRPLFPYPQAYCAIIGSHHIALGRIALHWVASHCIRSGHVASGQVSCAIIRLHRIALGCIALHWVVSHCIGLHCITLGRVSCTIINPNWCAIPPCCYSTPLHTLPHRSLRRFNLYLHVSLFSSCHCSPGCLSLAYSYPIPITCHYVTLSAVFPPVSFCSLYSPVVG